MSFSRQFVRELRPLFRMLEDPFGRSSITDPARFTRARGGPLAVFNDPFFHNTFGGSFSGNVPAVDVTEEPNAFVVEAELPGVKKENVDLRIGDNGQSLTIEGRTFFRSKEPQTATVTASDTVPEGQQTQTQSSDSTVASADASDDSQAVVQNNANSTALSTERQFSGESSFSRTIWLPRRVDSAGVAAKLEDGILTIRIPKAEDPQSVKISID